MKLDEWDIDLVVSDEDSSGNEAIGLCTSNPPYLYAKITVFKQAYVAPNDIDETIRHELAHCLTEPLYRYCCNLRNGVMRSPQDIEDQRELLTERISRLI